jgi:hypothetical protein
MSGYVRLGKFMSLYKRLNQDSSRYEVRSVVSVNIRLGQVSSDYVNLYQVTSG